MAGMLVFVVFVVFVVTEVLPLRVGFVSAICPDSRPTELEWQKSEQEDREPTTHEMSLAFAKLEEASEGSR